MDKKKCNQPKKEPPKYECFLCPRTFLSQSNFSRHLKTLHKSSAAERTKRICCPLCKSMHCFYTDLDVHLESEHSIPVIVKKLNFLSGTKDFEDWKHRIEKETISYFRQYNTKTKESTKITKYICHRSGTSRLQINRQRKLKVKGSNKITAHCPARITTTEKAGRLTVEYYETHVGHTQDIDRIHLTKSEKEAIAAKLINGTTSRGLVQDIRQEFDPTKRLSYTSTVDIYNIKKSFNIKSGVVFDKEDAVSVDTWISKLIEDSEVNPILAYKPYGVEDPDVGTDNFLLVFMSSVQQKLLNMYGNDILMIDTAHGINPYKIRLTTLMVVDENLEGFPVAFVWSISQVENVFTAVFECIKRRVPDLAPNYLMFDDTSVLYKAFTKVFRHFPNKLICDWHVKKNLFENLSKISGVDKRKEVKEDLEALIDELDTNEFSIALTIFIQTLLQDPGSEKYGSYFIDNYSQRTGQWAHCHKQESHRKTVMALKKWHQTIKCNTDCHQRLDSSIANVLQCLRVKYMKMLVRSCGEIIYNSQIILRNRHEMACELLSENIVQRENDGTFLVASSENTDGAFIECYEVTMQKMQNPCSCRIFCEACNFCLHKFSCTCPDYAIQYNMCKHVHLVGILFLKGELDDDDKSAIKDCIKVNKYENDPVSCQETSDSVRVPIVSKELEAKKKAALKELSRLGSCISECQSDEALSYVLKHLKVIQSGMIEIEGSSFAPKC